MDRIGCSSLILEAGANEASEEGADLPPAHAQALLAVSHGQVEYLRTSLSLGSRKIQALHFIRPALLDVVAVEGASEDGQNMPPLPWFGPEISAEPAYRRRRLARDGAPDVAEVDVTNVGLNSLLDLLEDRLTTWLLPHEPTITDAPPAVMSPSADARTPEFESEAPEEVDDLGIEDDVIRELARALQPRRG